MLDTQVSSSNKTNILGDGTASYDPDTSTLTLNGLQIKNGSVNGNSGKNYIYNAIYAANDLNIILKGNNQISADSTIRSGLYCAGIRCEDGGVTIGGSGSLSIVACNSNVSSYGISCWKDLTIKDSVTVSAMSGACGSSSGNLSAGIMAYSKLIVKDQAVLKASTPANYDNGKYTGICTSETVVMSGKSLEAKGSDMAICNPNTANEIVGISDSGKGYSIRVSTNMNANQSTSYIWDQSSALGSKNTPYQYVLITKESNKVFPFVDVKTSDWFYPWVKGAYDMGLINGRDEKHYEPEGDMTYAEAIKLAACMNQRYTTGKITLGNGTVNWYDPYVQYCLDKGIITQNYASVIDNNIDRQSYANIFAGCLPAEAFSAKNSIPGGSIPDVLPSNPYCKQIYQLYRAGVVNGVDEYGSFDPYANIKRGEVAAILNRMMDTSVRVGAPVSLPGGISISIKTQPDTGKWVKEGTRVPVSVEAQGGMAPYSYQWQYRYSSSDPWADFYSEANPSFGKSQTEKVWIWEYSEYRCIVTDASGDTVTSDVGVYNAGSELSIKTQPAQGGIKKKGDAVVLSVEAQGGKEPYSYQWQYRYSSSASWADFFMSGSTSYGKSNSVPVTISGYSEYRCIIKDASGQTVTSNSAIYKVLS